MGALQAAAFHVADAGTVSAVSFDGERTYGHGAVREDGVHMAAEGHIIVGIIRVGDDQRFCTVWTAVNPFYPPHGAGKVFGQIRCYFIDARKILGVAVNVDKVFQVFHILFHVVCCHVILQSAVVAGVT